MEAAELQAPRAKAASTGLSTHAPAHAGIQLPGALWPASPPVHPRGDAAPCFSEPESQQLCSYDHTLLSDLLKSGEKPRRNKRFFPGQGLGPQKPWSPRNGAALCTRAGLGRGTRAGMRARPSAPTPPGARPGCGKRAGGGVQDRAVRGVSVLLPAALVYLPPPPPTPDGKQATTALFRLRGELPCLHLHPPPCSMLGKRWRPGYSAPVVLEQLGDRGHPSSDHR